MDFSIILKVMLALVFVILILSIQNHVVIQGQVEGVCSTQCETMGFNKSGFKRNLCVCGDNISFPIYNNILN